MEARRRSGDLFAVRVFSRFTGAIQVRYVRVKGLRHRKLRAFLLQVLDIVGTLSLAISMI